MKFSYSDIFENCSFEEYINQYNPIQLELNKTYIQNKGNWMERTFTIVAIHNDTAMAVSLNPFNKKSFDYDLFYVKNGFKYQDTARPCYRLTGEVNNELTSWK